MLIEGSCHCGSVHFRATSHTPYPYMACYCSICRKTAGGGGYAINIMAEAPTLQVEGSEHVATYHAQVPDPDQPGRRIASPAARHFCRHCAAALWIADPRWPQWIYPFASAVDTPLPTPPEHVRIMLDHAAPWCEVPTGKGETHFGAYPEEAIVDWHKRRGLYDPS